MTFLLALLELAAVLWTWTGFLLFLEWLFWRPLLDWLVNDREI